MTTPSPEKRRPNFDTLPDVLNFQELRAFLPIGRNAIYDALNKQLIRNVRIGQKFLIPKAAIREFLGGDVE